MSECHFNLDNPTPESATGLLAPFRVSGWFVDAFGQPAKRISIRYGEFAVDGLPSDRPDVAEHFKPQRVVAIASGFSATLAPSPGNHRLVVEALTTHGLAVGIADFEISVAAPPTTEPPPGEECPEPPTHPPPVPILPLNARVVVSVLFYYREDLVFRCLEALLPQVRHAAEAAPIQITLVCVLNYPAPPGLAASISAFASQTGMPSDRVRLVIDQPGHNLGFGAGHNRAFSGHPSDLFVMVNSDVRMEQTDWLLRITELFHLERIGIAGLEATAAKLRADGCGIGASDPRQQGFDFVDGSLLVVNSATARRLGLFAEHFAFFYFEDADLCLRFRQAGCTPLLLDLAYHHDRFSSTRLLTRQLVEGVLDHNRARFFEVWQPFLSRRILPNRLLVVLPSQDKIVQCAALPALFGLLQDHPTASIEIAGVHPTLRSLFVHSQFVLRSSAPRDPGDRYHKVCRADTRLAPDRRLVDALAAQFGTEPNQPAVAAHLHNLVVGAAESKSVDVLCLIPQIPPYFQGLQPDLGTWTDIVSELARVSEHCVVYSEIPVADLPAALSPRPLQADTIPELLGILLQRPLVVAPDHWILQLVQLAGARLFTWMGATSPSNRLWRWTHCGSFAAPNLPCLGCSHVLGSLHENTCLRGDLACIDAKLRTTFLEQLKEFRAASATTSWMAPALVPPILSQRRAPSAEMDLSRWRQSTVGNVLVLIPTKPGLPDSMLARCRTLAEHAIRQLPGSRVVLDDRASAAPRGNHAYRQAALAAIRQEMINRNLQDERWIFWVDADIVNYAEDLVVQLVHRSEGGIAAPVVIMDGELGPPTNSHGFGPGRFFDVAGFVEQGRWAAFTKPYFKQPGPAYDLDSVGSCYLVPADLYRRGARHEADPLSQAFVAANREWPDNAVQLGQAGEPLAYTEHYSVCEFARRLGLPVRAHGDLVAIHERVG